MRSDETVFSFDVKPFLKGVESIGKGMDRVAANAKAFGGALTGAIGRGVNSLIVKAGALLAAFKGIGSVLREMPEVGQAFGLAKDVFLKNLLWPLRQQVMPLLQDMLDWTRDHRARFATWGVAVANVFRAAVTVGRELFKVLSTLAGAVADSFQRTFGTSFKSLDEFINVFSFKVSAIIIYMGILAQETIGKLQPVIDWTLGMGKQVIDFFTELAEVWGRANSSGDSLYTVLKKIKTTIKLIGDFTWSAANGFKDGFIAAVSESMTPLGNLIDEFNRLLLALGFGDRKGVYQAFKSIGTAAGEALNWVLEMGTEIVGFFADLAGYWAKGNESGRSLWTVAEKIGKTFRTIGSFVSNAVASFRQGFGPAVKELMTPIDSVVGSINRLLDVVGFNNEEGVRGAFQSLGAYLGTGLTVSMNSFATTIDLVVTSIASLVLSLKGMWQFLGRDAEGAKKTFGEIGRMYKEFGNKTQKMWAPVFESLAEGLPTVGNVATRDAATRLGITITPEMLEQVQQGKSLGDALKAAGDWFKGLFSRDEGAEEDIRPEAGPMSFAPMSGAGGTQVSLVNQFGDIYVTEGNAKAAGVRLGEGIRDGFYNRIAAAQLREGA